MVTIGDLWLPILVSAVFVFAVSTIVHMLLPFHKSDYGKLDGEDSILSEMRKQGVKPGEYMFPYIGSMKEMKSPGTIEKYNQGPVGIVSVLPSGLPKMGKNLVQWFIFLLIVSFFVAYISKIALPSGSEYIAVFRMASTIAILGYGAGQLHNSIWRGQRWRTTMKYIVDAVLYGLVTGGVFGWLWP